MISRRGKTPRLARRAPQPAVAQAASGSQWMGPAALAAIGASVALMVVMGAQRPSAAQRAFPAAPPWPPWSAGTDFSGEVVALSLWAAALLGGIGVVLGLLAVRRGWRPRPRLVIIGSVAAVVALMVIGPVGSGDMLDYAAYGRIAVLGHSPYLMTVYQLRKSGDPVGAFAPRIFQRDPSVYGPLATASEWTAAKLGGASAARTVFWLKVWNALAYLAIVLALDRVLRGDAAQRARAHLLWSVNPLMLLAVMAGGHIDGLAAALGIIALIALRRMDVRHALLAGALVGAAAAVKADFLLFGFGLAWAVWRSPRALAALGLGGAAVLVPSYLLAGPGAMSAVVNRASGNPVFFVPWQLLTQAVHLSDATRKIDLAGVIAFALLAAILLWRLPAGPSALPAGPSALPAGSSALAAVRPALAVTLAWLMVSPQQRPWYDAMLFPLVALMPATRLDWIVIFRGAAGAIAELPGVLYYLSLRPAWLSRTGEILSLHVVPVSLALAIAGLLVLCITRRWTPAGGRDGPASRRPLPGTSPAGAQS